MRLLLTLLIVTQLSFAGGSIFGTQATGDPTVTGGVRSVGLGGAGLAIWDSVGMHSDNPAAAAYMTGAMLRAGLHTGLYSVSGQSDSDSDSEFGWQTFWLYLNVHPRYKMGLAIEPIGRSDVRTFTQDSLAFPTDTGIVYHRFENRNVWLGSNTNIRWNHSLKLTNNIALGATAGFLTSYHEVQQTLDFPSTGSANGPRDAVYRDLQRFSGFWGGLSFIVKPSEKLSLGGFWNSEADGDWDVERAVNHGGATQFAEITGNRPGSLGLGIGYRWQKRWAVYADVKQQSWTTKHYGPLFENTDLKDQDAISAMLGVEKIGATRVTDEGFDRWDFRAGVAYRKQPWQVISGSKTSDVFETALSLGLSIPLAEQAGKLHTSLEIGQRNASDVDVTETFTRFYLQLDMHEQWFKRERRKLRN